MKLRVKLPVAFVLSLLLLFGAGMFGIARVGHAVDVYQFQVMRSVESGRLIAHVANDFSAAIQEWKNVLLRGKEDAKREKYWSDHVVRMGEVRSTLLRLREAVGEGAAKDQVVQLIGALEVADGRYAKAFGVFKAAGNDFAAGDQSAAGADRMAAGLINALQSQLSSEENAISSAASAGAAQSRDIAYVLMFCVTLLATAAGFWLSRQIVHPLKQAVDVANRVAKGDLTNRIAHGRKDEIGELLAALDAMQLHLAGIVAQVRRDSENVAHASAEIAAGNHDLSMRTEAQASALGETASSVHALGAAVGHGADCARQASALAHSASAVAVRGGEIVNQVVETMEGINTSSNRIADIISVIDGIAFQTNILALNAAVEAARAGDQGRGFAVVASEVRALAGRSAAAAKEITQLINASVERVKHGSTLVGQAGATMGEVVQSIRAVADMVGGISTAIDVQKSSVTQADESMGQLDQTNQQNAAMVEEMAAAATGLQELAAQLVTAVAAFQIVRVAATPHADPAQAGMQRLL